MRAAALCIRMLAATMVLPTLSACVVLPPYRFEREAEGIKKEAARLFAVGSEATAFETWFAGRAGTGLRRDPSPANAAARGQTCEPRTMSLQRAEGCMNVLMANYCVDNAGKLRSLAFDRFRYC
jgi:hypothetical protein